MKNIFCFFAFATLLANSCTHYYYMPNSMVMPAIQKQHDAVINFGKCDFGGRELQAVYSPLKYTAVLYNHVNIPRKNSNAGGWGRGRFHEGGIGTYYGKSLWTLSLLGGYGKGFAESAYTATSGNSHHFIHSNLNFQRWFVQPGFVLQNKSVRFGMAFRQVWLRYDKGVIEVNQYNYELVKAIQGIERGSPFCFTEFGMTLGLRLPPFGLSYNSASIFGEEAYYKDLGFARTNHSFMVSIDIHELVDFFRKRKTRPQEMPPAQD